MNHRSALATMLALGMSLAMAPAAVAQGPEPAHPAHIHAGSCPEPGDVVAPLSDVSVDMNVDGAASASAEAVGQASAIPVQASVTTVPLALADIVAAAHAINVHVSAEDLGTYIACGDIGGRTIGEAELPIGLGELNASGVSGVAWLRDNGDGTTTVSVALVSTAGPAAAGAGESVAIVDFSFDPAGLEVAAGTTVTWTNQDSSQHTATAEDGSFDSGVLSQGDTFGHTFDVAGTYAYICAIHPTMTGTITVG